MTYSRKNAYDKVHLRREIESSRPPGGEIRQRSAAVTFAKRIPQDRCSSWVGVTREVIAARLDAIRTRLASMPRVEPAMDFLRRTQVAHPDDLEAPVRPHLLERPGRRLDGVESADHAAGIEIRRAHCAMGADVILHLLHLGLEAPAPDPGCRALVEQSGGEDREPVAAHGEDRVMGLDELAAAIEHGIEIGDAAFAPGEPGELVIAQARDPDRIDLDHGELGRQSRQLGRGPQRAGEAETVKEEAPQLDGLDLAHG
jgi:hypothetical protein